MPVDRTAPGGLRRAAHEKGEGRDPLEISPDMARPNRRHEMTELMVRSRRSRSGTSLSGQRSYTVDLIVPGPRPDGAHWEHRTRLSLREHSPTGGSTGQAADGSSDEVLREPRLGPCLAQISSMSAVSSSARILVKALSEKRRCFWLPNVKV